MTPQPRRRRAGLDQPRSRAPITTAPRGSGGRPGDGGNGTGNGNGKNGTSQLRRRRASLYRRSRGAPRRPRLLRLTLLSLAFLIVLSGGGAGAAFAGYNIYKSQLPDAATIVGEEPAQDSYVYDATGRLIYVFNGSTQGYRHTHVDLSHISRWFRMAIVDIEDRHFYSEGSWDIPRLLAAGVNDLTRGTRQGGSTITEQLAKISFFGSASPRSLDYKIKEIVLGNEIASNFTKDQILEMYVNRIFFGNYALGVETAAQLYFFTDSSKLDLAQSAMLAGLPQSPSYYNPLNHSPDTLVNPIAKVRQHDVLESMVANGDITQQQADTAYAEPIAFHSWTESEPMVAPDFLTYLKGWLDSHFGSSYLKPGGWRILTTLDPARQAIAEQTVQNEIDTNGDRFNMHGAALVSIDPRTGELLDMVGTGNPATQHVSYTNLATSMFTPGSSIKLFTYTAAIASGKFTMTTPILDAPTSFPVPNDKPYQPFDYDRRWHGTCLLKTCLGNSFNVPAVKVEVGTGIPYINNFEIAAGVNSLQRTCRDANGNVVSNVPAPTQWAATLGGFTCGVTLLDLADGASTIADLGVHHDVIPVTKILDSRTGNSTIFEYDPAKVARRVVPENVAYIMDEITSNDANRAYEFGSRGLLTLPDRRVSAKTGTGEYFQDNLTVGWTPQLLTAVWVGNPYPFVEGCPPGAACGPLYGIASGITGAAPIWHNYMRDALKDTPVEWYKRPADVVATGPSDDADFYLPGAARAYTGCFYWGPSPQPSNPCLYTGTSPPAWYVPTRPRPNPSFNPEPTPAPGNGGDGGNGGHGGHGGHGPPPTPPAAPGVPAATPATRAPPG